MKNIELKFNLGVLKNKYVLFDWVVDNKKYQYGGIIDSVKSKKNQYIITFEHGVKVSATDVGLAKCKIREDGDHIIVSYSPLNDTLSGFVGFSMYDTYGFPIEITREILNDDGFEIDMDGYYILKRLQKEQSLGTFKNKDGWKN